MKLPIHIYQACEVDNEVVNVRKSAGDEVVWSSEGDEFIVEFPITPFARNKFVVPAKGSVNSGPVRPDAPITLYRYGITNVALAMSADPDLDVKP
jgi:hypothetical protein